MASFLRRHIHPEHHDHTKHKHHYQPTTTARENEIRPAPGIDSKGGAFYLFCVASRLCTAAEVNGPEKRLGCASSLLLRSVTLASILCVSRSWNIWRQSGHKVIEPGIRGRDKRGKRGMSTLDSTCAELFGLLGSNEITVNGDLYLCFRCSSGLVMVVGISAEAQQTAHVRCVLLCPPTYGYLVACGETSRQGIWHNTSQRVGLQWNNLLVQVHFRPHLWMPLSVFLSFLSACLAVCGCVSACLPASWFTHTNPHSNAHPHKKAQKPTKTCGCTHKHTHARARADIGAHSHPESSL